MKENDKGKDKNKAKDKDKTVINYEALGVRVREWRNQRNISQEAMSIAIEKSIQHISNIERAHTKVSLATITEIANFLDCSLNDLLCDSLKNSGNAYSKEYSNILKDCDESHFKKYNKAFMALVETFEGK